MFRKLPTTCEELCRVYFPWKIHEKAECRRAKAVNWSLSILEVLDYVPGGAPTAACVPISVDSDAFEVSETKQKLRLDGSSIYLPVQKKAGHLSGWLKDEKGNPVPGASINVAGLSKVTDSSGYFEFSIPGHQMQALAHTLA